MPVLYLHLVQKRNSGPSLSSKYVGSTGLALTARQGGLYQNGMCLQIGFIQTLRSLNQKYRHDHFNQIACWVILHAFLSHESTFSKNSFRNTTRVSNSLDQDQDRIFVGSDLGPTVCKGKQQTEQVGKEKIKLYEFLTNRDAGMCLDFCRLLRFFVVC